MARRDQGWWWLLPALSVLSGCHLPQPEHPPTSSPGAEVTMVERLSLGSSPHREQRIRLRSGELRESATGQCLDFGAAIDRLSEAQVVFVGESHAHREHHQAEARVLAALASRQPGRWALGMEMFPRSKQPILDRWVAGELEERELVRQVGWYQVWGFDWRYYRELLLLAREHHLPVVALNVEPELARRVGREGLERLSAAERGALPPLDLSWEEHRRLVRAMLGLPSPDLHPSSPSSAPAGHRSHPHRGLFEHLYQAQVLRDVSMAERALNFLQGEGRGRRLLVVAGSGHLLYGLGMNGRLAARQPSLPQRTVICLGVDDEPLPTPAQSVSGSSPATGGVEGCPAASSRPAVAGELVSAGLGDLLWGTAADSKAVQYPKLGVGLADGELRVTRVSPHGAAAKLLQAGDLLLELDGQPITDLFDLRWRLEEKGWGDQVRLRLRRAGTDRTVVVRFSK